MKRFALSTVLASAAVFTQSACGAKSPQTVHFPLFTYLTGSTTPKMVAYSPSELDPRFKKNHELLAKSSIEADLKVMRSVFDGFITYGYNKASTPRIMAAAKKLKFRAVLLGIWDPKSTEEIDGVVALVNQYHKDIALGVIVGNEGILFKRYKPSDLNAAADRLLDNIPPTIPITTSEPLFVSLQSGFIRYFGDFMAANIHPVWDRKELSARDAAQWTREQAMKLALKAEKPVLVKETGFPHGGREGFSLKTQKDFWAAYLQEGVLVRSPKHNDIWVFHGVAFEAFDLPWKTIATNIPIEKSWGLLSTDRKAYPALSVWREVSR